MPSTLSRGRSAVAQLLCAGVALRQSREQLGLYGAANRLGFLRIRALVPDPLCECGLAWLGWVSPGLGAHHSNTGRGEVIADA